MYSNWWSLITVLSLSAIIAAFTMPVPGETTRNSSPPHLTR
jgi:hypothetical protein